MSRTASDRTKEPALQDKSDGQVSYWDIDKSPLITILRWTGYLLPGDYLKTLFYINCVMRVRKAVRLALESFYRMDHVYEVLAEFGKKYHGKFAILEFGVADGYAFTKKLYACKYLGLQDRVLVLGFDTFEGMPETADRRDEDLVAGDNWYPGQFSSKRVNLENYCRSKYSNFALFEGLFSDTVNAEVIATLTEYRPILVWIDCDYYTSARDALVPLLPHLPNGCVVYFDEPELNYGSRFTGEARLVHEVNRGLYGDEYELVLDRQLSLNLSRVYRFINFAGEFGYEPVQRVQQPGPIARHRGDDSPFP
jgi:Macrocin-O-methyltransferase (TylF)